MLKENQASHQLVENLFFLFRVLRQGSESQACKGGFTIPQRIVMALLAKYGDLNVKELSQKVGLAHSTISGIVDRLERKGMVMRFQDPRDRRVTKVRFTGLAENHFKNILPRQVFSPIVDAFNKAATGDQVKILEGLKSLRQLLDKGENK